MRLFSKALVVLRLSSLEMDLRTQVQLLIQETNTLGKGMHPTILPVTMSTIVGQTWVFNFGMVTGFRVGKFEFKLVKLHRKLTLCHTCEALLLIHTKYSPKMKLSIYSHGNYNGYRGFNHHHHQYILAARIFLIQSHHSSLPW